MKRKRVWLLSGIPGSGKSTWIDSQLSLNGLRVKHSRDNVRFRILKNGESYFSHEKEVFKQWINEINDDLNNPDVTDVYIDATHINDKSRHKTLSRLNMTNVKEITHVVMNVPVDICLTRNAIRKGLAKVPNDVILRMAENFDFPKDENPVLTIEME